jgi:hypothetical protein
MPLSTLVRFTVFLIALGAAHVALAQAATGAIIGTVRDSSGGAIPAASVRIASSVGGEYVHPAC